MHPIDALAPVLWFVLVVCGAALWLQIVIDAWEGSDEQRRRQQRRAHRLMDRQMQSPRAPWETWWRS